MTVVVGTAGHIDHGKTTLLRALTGIDADRLPEERRRGMTIDVGYAHLTLPDGTELDFVDVPGHDRLVGNMLVGAGEIDAALLVVAADDGLRAQTHEHIDLLDALAVRHALVAITKADLVPEARTGEVCEAVAARLSSTALAGVPIVVVSGTTGEGIADLRAGLITLRDRAWPIPAGLLSARPVRLAVDRTFHIKGRGTVVTGTLRGGPLARGANVSIVPGDATVRVREVQVHGTPAEEVAGGGRTALNLAGEPASRLHRGVVLTNDPELHATDRLLVTLAASVPDRSRFRVHLGTAAAEVVVGRSGRDAIDLPTGAAAAVLRVDASLAAATGDRFVLRRAATSGPAVVGGVILDPLPARGVSRRRQTAERVAALAAAAQAADPAAIHAARIDLHGIVASERFVAADVHVAASAAALKPSARTTRHAQGRRPGPGGRPVRSGTGASTPRDCQLARRGSTCRRPRGRAGVRRTSRAGRRPGPRARPPAGRGRPGGQRRDGSARGGPRRPRSAFVARCRRRCRLPTRGDPRARAHGRIVVLDEDLAYAMPTYRDLAAKALALAARGPSRPRRSAMRPAPAVATSCRSSRTWIARHPPADPGRPRSGTAGTGGCSRRNVTSALLPAVSAIVLAGGRSARFGRDKLAVSIDGRPLLHHAAEAVAAVATDIIVIAPPDVAPLPVGVRLVHDEAPFEGPLAGLTGLLAAREPLVVVVGGDMPSLEPAVLALLIRRSSRRRPTLPSSSIAGGVSSCRSRCAPEPGPTRPGGCSPRGAAAWGTDGPPDRAGACGGGVAPAGPRCGHLARRRRADGSAGRLAAGPGHETSAGGGAEVYVYGSEERSRRSAPVWVVEEGGAVAPRRRRAWRGS